jgi:L-iditol 2-dehydrogenase
MFAYSETGRYRPTAIENPSLQHAIVPDSCSAMKAVVKYATGPGMTEVRDVPIPVPAEGEALIRVKAAGVCASDVHLYHDRFPHVPPLVLGHEFCGVVEAVGPGVDKIRAADIVVSENNPSACGTCRVCRDGYPNLCTKKRAMGFKSDGCFAEYISVPSHLLHKVPEGVSVHSAALSEPLAIAVHAVDDRCGIEEGDTVVVLGPGAIGLLSAQVARAIGAGHVIVAGTDRDADRLACAERLGFETANVLEGGLPERVLTLTDGAGVDVVVECAGAVPAVELGIELLRRAGRMVAIGITGEPQIHISWDALIIKGATVEFSFSSRTRNWEKGMEFLKSGKVDNEALITQVLPLESWQEAFGKMEKLESIRTLLEPA